MSLLTDERGSRSSARVFFLAWSIFAQGVVIADIAGFEVVAAVYQLLVSVLLALVAWAGGARIAQYVGPGISGVVGAIRDRLKGTDDHRRDDER